MFIMSGFPMRGFPLPPPVALFLRVWTYHHPFKWPLCSSVADGAVPQTSSSTCVYFPGGKFTWKGVAVTTGALRGMKVEPQKQREKRKGERW